jgi:succinylglutamate desuccinylase
MPSIIRILIFFTTVAQVCLQDGIDFSFHRQEADLLLNADLETLNFTEVLVGTSFGKLNGKNNLPLIAKNEAGVVITENFFSNQNSYLAVNRPQCHRC